MRGELSYYIIIFIIMFLDLKLMGAAGHGIPPPLCALAAATRQRQWQRDGDGGAATE